MERPSPFWQLATTRLILRKLEPEDFDSLCRILQDPEVMYAYEGPFSREEVQAWLDKMLTRYKQEGVALYAVCLKETGRMIGQCGLTMQDIPGSRGLEGGYLFEKAYWHRGGRRPLPGLCL